MTEIQQKHIRTVEDHFAEGVLTILGKMEDYSSDSDPWSNFRFSADAAGITVDQGFLFLYGVKIARLRELLVAGKTPNNESIDDTLVDLSNYAAVHRSYREHGKLVDTFGGPEVTVGLDGKVRDAETGEEVTWSPAEPEFDDSGLVGDPAPDSAVDKMRAFFGFGKN